MLAFALIVMGCISLLFGYHTRHGAVLLFGMTIIAAVAVHDFLAYRRSGGAPAEFEIFARDVAICGGLLLMVGMGCGPFGWDNRRRAGQGKSASLLAVVHARATNCVHVAKSSRLVQKQFASSRGLSVSSGASASGERVTCASRAPCVTAAASAPKRPCHVQAGDDDAAEAEGGDDFADLFGIGQRRDHADGFHVLALRSTQPKAARARRLRGLKPWRVHDDQLDCARPRGRGLRRSLAGDAWLARRAPDGPIRKMRAAAGKIDRRGQHPRRQHPGQRLVDAAYGKARRPRAERLRSDVRAGDDA